MFQEGDLVWMGNYLRKKGENPKLQPKYLGPYTITQALGNHTYEVQGPGYHSIQNELRLKLCKPYGADEGKAPHIPEIPRWLPTGGPSISWQSR